MIINQVAKGGSGGAVVIDGIIIKTRDVGGKALTVDFYGTEVKKDQFYNQTATQGAWVNMSSITFKNNITVIADYAFNFCNSLVMSLPLTLVSLGNYAFRSCVALINLILPDGITSLGQGVFRGCTGLLTINCPRVSSVHGLSIVTGCFMDCTNLTEVTLGSVGYPVTSIGTYAFCNCTQAGLTINVYVTAGTKPLANSPWGATNATIKYFDAATGNEIV